MGLLFRRALSAALALCALIAEPAAAAEPLTVVELFTSQGCSSYPPANANLAAISDRPGILALSFGVTYWDRLGWKDTLAKKIFTDRQISYEAPLGESGPFTPQMIVNGRRSIVGNDKRSVDRVIAASAADDKSGPPLELGDRSVNIGEGRAIGGGFDVWLVRYDPRSIDVPIRRGENAGRMLPHRNVVHDLDRIRRWSGEKLTIRISDAAPALKTAVLLQRRNGGPVVAAVTD